MNFICKLGLKIKQKSCCFIALLLVFIPSFAYSQTTTYSVTAKPSAGSTSQNNSDVILSSKNGSFGFENNNLTCSQSQDGNDLIYDYKYFGDDFDDDGSIDTVKFTLRVLGYSNTVYNFTEANANTSSVSTLGSSALVESSKSFWGVNDGSETTLNDVDAGETIEFQVENLSISVNDPYSASLSGFTAAYINETDAGYGHQFISGLGENLSEFSTNLDETVSYSDNEQSIYLTGAGSNVLDTKEWGVQSVSFVLTIFNANNPDFWDLSDYSGFSVGDSYVEAYPDQESGVNFPEFSWNYVPRWLAFRSTAALSDSIVEVIANHYQIVLLEKANQQGESTVDKGTLAIAARLKAVNPNIKLLFYWNSYIQYEGYSFDAEFDANEWEWNYKEVDANGDSVMVLHKDIYNRYNYDSESLREWWITSALTMVDNDLIDGVFIDKCGGISGDNFTNAGEPTNNQIKMVYELSQRMPDNKMMVGNVLRNEWGNGGRDALNYMEGSYLERWNMQNRDADPSQSDGDILAVTIQLMREALSKGKMINFQTGPDIDNITDIEDEAERQQLVEDEVTFPLAMFLIVAEENAFFSFQSGVNALEVYSNRVVWETSYIDVFNRPLGEPLGDPVKNGYIYTRSYEYVDVWLDVENRDATLTWRDDPISLPSSSSEGSSSSSSDDVTSNLGNIDAMSALGVKLSQNGRELTITSTSADLYQVEVFDILGNKVQTKVELGGAESINLSVNLGVNILRITTNSGAILFKKVTIQN